MDHGLPSSDVRTIDIAPDGAVWAGTSEGLAVLIADPRGVDQSHWQEVDSLSGRNIRVVEATRDRVFVLSGAEVLELVWPEGSVATIALDSPRVSSLFSARDPQARFISLAGSENLRRIPVADLTSVEVDRYGGTWAGTSRGLVHWTPGGFEYRQGRRWLPDDDVRDIAVDQKGQVWAATAGGVGHIELRSMTLKSKADLFETAIATYHRRTPYGYVDGVHLPKAGDLSEWQQRSSDNDGLWTAMYGAAQCFAFAATGAPEAARRARQAYEALRFLGEVTQGGSPLALPGFVARSILPTDGPDPNEGMLERDLKRRAERDGKWKVLEPRWPKSADGRWYWKTDTSSDELDGHFFFYALYYDLVADAAEQARVAETVTGIVDHLIEHDFSFIDHDGQPTRWAVFGPKQLNFDRDWWEERGLNSLSMLSYLRVAQHTSGDQKYAAVAQELIDTHGYAQNVRVPKAQMGPGTGNQSDDEMALMGFYSLLRYEEDPELRQIWSHSLWQYAQLIAPERNPFFNLLAAALLQQTSYRDAFGEVDTRPRPEWIDDAIDSLIRYPLDRVDWPLTNSHRLDVIPLRDSDPRDPRGHRRDGKVLPIDERFIGHWNHDPWRLDYRGQGHRLADGASFLLPYYLGLYHGLIVQQ